MLTSNCRKGEDFLSIKNIVKSKGRDRFDDINMVNCISETHN